MPEPVVNTCRFCKQAINDANPTEVTDQQSGQKFLAHDLCFLRTDRIQTQQYVRTLIGVLCGITKKLGGSLVLHQKDIDAGVAEAKGALNIKTQPDGSVKVFYGPERLIITAPDVSVLRTVK